jgi:predicted nucleic acid-binding protein
MILLDTSVLIASLTSPKSLLDALQDTLSLGERLIVPTIVLYEWWRGPRLEQELRMQEIVFPTEMATVFGAAEARIAAQIYRQISRRRGREMDLAIAACAIAREVPLWTLNRKDFADIPGLALAHIH